MKQALERAANGIKSKITSELPNVECEENKAHSVGATMTDSECEIMKQLYGDSVEKDPELMRTEIKEFCNWSSEMISIGIKKMQWDERIENVQRMEWHLSIKTEK